MKSIRLFAFSLLVLFFTELSLVLIFGGAEGRISVGDDPVALVGPTDEELLIAKDALALARGARKE